ncbi:cystatin-B-like [Hyla sarda]|uniref:cystatin-B-like n=1 Tax=Hyla sarda TaxID=327740 RepID=UPI0024C2D6AD|nr:cystatin-B-like [Hyla sarda]
MATKHEQGHGEKHEQGHGEKHEQGHGEKHEHGHKEVGEEKPADEKVQALCDKVKPDFEHKSGIKAEEFKAVRYASKVVHGMDHFVKVWLGKDHFCHLKIHEPPHHTGEKPALHDYQLNKTKHDHIHHF